MIGFLSGTARGRCVVAGGVGYLVHTPEPLVDGAHVELEVTTVVRDDAIILFGFPTTQEQDLFVALCKVQGVGPQMALALLRDVGWQSVTAAVASGDDKTLRKASGVGPKVAERIVSTVTLPGELVAAAANDGDDSTLGDVVEMLENLGFDRTKALEAARDARAKTGGGDEAQLLSAALGHLRGAA